MKNFLIVSAATLFILMNVISCNTPQNDKESKKNTFNDSTNMKNVTTIPDSVVNFLITSAAKDFYDHQPPTVVDIRNVKAGYILPDKLSDKDTTYLICGEFLSKEKNEWESFATLKTSGYEQYIGNSFYCQKTTFESVDNNILSDELKRKLDQLKK
jgi:hypothetical protein